MLEVIYEGADIDGKDEVRLGCTAGFVFGVFGTISGDYVLVLSASGCIQS
jgi:hypothetical protein